MTSNAVEIVREFWARMQINDSASVADVLTADFVLEGPQSRERIPGAERFVRMSADYPAHGRWEFTIHRIVGGEGEAVSDVTTTDSVQQARPISSSRRTTDGCAGSSNNGRNCTRRPPIGRT
jgi:limonene-1,2-epoxide hydrolase